MQKCLWSVPHHKHWSDLRCWRHLVSNPSSGRACRGLFPVLLIKNIFFCDAVAWSLRTAVYAGRPCLHEVHHLAAKGSRFPPAERNAGACHRHIFNQNKQTVATTGCCTYCNNFSCPGCTGCSKDSLISTCAKNKYGEP